MDSAPVLEISSGFIRGIRRPETGSLRFSGIPYAAPPVGALRFAAPTPAEPWTGVRDATEIGFAAPQYPGRIPKRLAAVVAARRSRSEDCLTLNVDTPALDGPPRPVVVWIHGGGFTTGTSGLYDGSRLATDGDVVVVSVNYRVGGLGFVDFGSALGGDPRIASNLGLRDQIAALEWVRDNVAAFGGDPERVTIAGHSAGAGCVAALLTSPAARGLFHGAIAQSGALTLTTDAEDAERAAHEVLGRLDLSRDRADELWRLPASAIVRATQEAQDARTGSLVTRPWWDGDVLPASLAAGYDAVAPVPLMIGWTHDEHRTFTRLKIAIIPMTRAALDLAITEALGPADAAALLAAYPDDPAGLNALGTDLVFGMPSQHLAERQAPRAPTFAYRLDLQAGRFGLGAYHGVDLLLQFPQTPRAEWIAAGRPGADRLALAERFRAAWLGFVRGASPGDDWPAYDPAGARSVRIFDRADRIVDDLEGERRRVWAGRDIRIR
ncbi:MAG: carboxylesterase/lipase family protein [Solirubrobacteraceae bacterium]|nr:carboxylesterase/lipase family protein [Solirubrobacteraceae bacterium]